MTLNDDGSITFTRDRLSINLKPMTDDELNRLNAASADPSLNPYTFGEWTAPGDEHTPPRFTIFRLTVNNYQYPKIQIDPLSATDNGEQALLRGTELFRLTTTIGPFGSVGRDRDAKPFRRERMH